MSDLISRQYLMENYQQVCAVVSCKECPFLIKDGNFLIHRNPDTDCRLERFIMEMPHAEPKTVLDAVADYLLEVTKGDRR